MKVRKIRPAVVCSALVLAATAFARVDANSAITPTSGATVADTAVAQQCKFKPDQPRILIVTFASSVDSIGVRAADTVRHFWTRDRCKEYFPITKGDINGSLGRSGFDTTKAAESWNVRLLAVQTSADVVVAGTASYTRGQWTITPHLVVPIDERITQPLTSVSGNRLTIAAQRTLPVIDEALVAMPDFRKCWLAEGEKRHEDAVASAKAAIAKYARSTMARVCLAQALENLKMSPDTILAVVNAVLAINPKDYFAIRFAERAERSKENVDKANVLIAQLLALNPTDVALQEEVITKYAAQGNYAEALKVLNDAKQSNPGHPSIVNLEATICFATKDYKCAIAAYEELATVDTAAVNIQFFERLVRSHRELKEYKEAAGIARRGIAKFPAHVNMHLYLSQMLREGGDTAASIEAAKNALALDPTQFDIYLQIAGNLGSGKLDSLVAVLTSALPHAKTQPDSATMYNLAFAPAQVIFGEVTKVADSLKTDEDWAKFETVIKMAEFAHKVIPTNAAKFYIGASNYFLALRSYRIAEKAQVSDRKLACDMATNAAERVARMQELINEGGGRTDGVREFVGQMMNSSLELRPAANEIKTKSCASGFFPIH